MKTMICTACGYKQEVEEPHNFMICDFCDAISDVSGTESKIPNKQELQEHDVCFVEEGGFFYPAKPINYKEIANKLEEIGRAHV